MHPNSAISQGSRDEFPESWTTQGAKGLHCVSLLPWLLCEQVTFVFPGEVLARGRFADVDFHVNTNISQWQNFTPSSTQVAAV